MLRCNNYCLTILFIALASTCLTAYADKPRGQGKQTLHGDQAASATLNLKNAEIANLIATVSQITGKNFVVDPRVKGNVTVVSSPPMTPAGVYQAFLSVLQVHGYAAIPVGDIIKIVPEVKAKQQGGARVETGNGKSLPPGDMVTKVIRVTNVPAAQLVPVLRPLVPQYGHLAAYKPTNMLIISDRAANVKRLTHLVERLDHNRKQNISVVKLKNANAPDLVTSLTKLVKKNEKSQATHGPSPTIIANERTNAIIVKGSDKQRARIHSLIEKLDKPTAASGGTQVIYLHYADAEDLAKVLKGYVKGEEEGHGSKKSTNVSTGDVKVIAAKNANALVVTAPPDKMSNIRSVIQQLDIRRAQVLVQAIIAEITVNKARQLGVDFAAFNPNNIAVASLEQHNPSQVANAVANGGTGALLGLLKQGANAALGITTGGTTFAALLNALYSNGKTNVLSTPSLVTLDNEKAKITVGKQVPFLTGSYTNTNGTNISGGVVNPFQTIERKKVGIQLSITPQINQGNTVKLKIKAKDSTIANSTGVNAVDLITNERTLDTTVNVDDGDILVLGGLIDNNTQQQQKRVPILGSLPLIGALFRYQTSEKKKRDLMLFIRPVIFRGEGKANYYTRKKYNYIRRIQLKGQGEHLPLMQQETVPVLAPIDELRNQGTSQDSSNAEPAQKFAPVMQGHSGQRRPIKLDSGNGGQMRSNSYAAPGSTPQGAFQ